MLPVSMRITVACVAVLMAALCGCCNPGTPMIPTDNLETNPHGALHIKFGVNMSIAVDGFAARNGLAPYADSLFMTGTDSTEYTFRVDRRVVSGSISHRAKAVQLVQAFPDTIQGILVTPSARRDVPEESELIVREP
jgi:hypothetical protein